MIETKYILGIGLISIIFSGCSSKYEVTFDSNPRGATLICNGKNWGYTPIKLYYDEEVKEYKAMNVSSCSANWVSGYSANYPKDMTIFPEGGTITTLNRPTYGEGYPMDAQFALQVEQMKAQQSQAQAAQMSAQYQQQANTNQQIQNNLNNLNNLNNNMQMQNLNNNLNNLNNNLNNSNSGGYYNGGGYYNEKSLLQR